MNFMQQLNWVRCHNGWRRNSFYSYSLLRFCFVCSPVFHGEWNNKAFLRFQRNKRHRWIVVRGSTEIEGLRMAVTVTSGWKPFDLVKLIRKYKNKHKQAFYNCLIVHCMLPTEHVKCVVELYSIFAPSHVYQISRTKLHNINIRTPLLIIYDSPTCNTSPSSTRLPSTRPISIELE